MWYYTLCILLSHPAWYFLDYVFDSSTSILFALCSLTGGICAVYPFSCRWVLARFPWVPLSLNVAVDILVSVSFRCSHTGEQHCQLESHVARLQDTRVFNIVTDPQITFLQ